MRSFVVCYPQRVRESSEQKTPCSLAPGCFGQIGRPGFQDSASCTNAAHIFGELQLIKQMLLMVIFYFSAHLLSLPSRGAWIEISSAVGPLPPSLTSLPSRGAWIEMLLWVLVAMAAAVAPLAGSVDRNFVRADDAAEATASLPSRGAWIEITCCTSASSSPSVAPLAGSVDRNWFCSTVSASARSGRSPRGERG